MKMFHMDLVPYLNHKSFRNDFPLVSFWQRVFFFGVNKGLLWDVPFFFKKNIKDPSTSMNVLFLYYPLFNIRQ